MSNAARAGVYLAVLVLGVTAYVVWSAVLRTDTAGTLRISFFDVGQGDAIFIQTPKGTQVLIDGGKGGAVLGGLGRAMAFTDRTINLVIATHPDMDHIGGLPEVFARYQVGMYMEPGVHDDGPDYAALIAAVAHEQLTPVYARAGTTIPLDEGVFLEILFPDRDVAGLETNTASIVVRLVYGDTSALLTGDSPSVIEEYLVSVHGEGLKSDILKLGHHGSHTSTSQSFLGFVDPAYGIVSAGCDNSYGHPHKEVTALLAQYGVQQLGTCEEGTITFESDGVEWVRR
jgi:competence protein ComEC